MTERAFERINNELEIAQDLPFEKRSWLMQRIAWIAGALVLIAALLGVFGNGPLSRTEKSSQDGALRLEYQRIVRFQAPCELRIHIADSQSNDKAFQLWVSSECFENTLLNRITPEPQSSTLKPDGIIHEFKRQAQREPVEVIFRFDIEKIGSINGSIALINARGDQHSNITFTQFALP